MVSLAKLPDMDLALMEAHAEEAARLLRSLANPNRLLVLCLLTAGEMSVSELNAALPLSQSALSQHLAVLREEGLVATRRDAQTIFYRVPAGPALEVLALLHGIYCGPESGKRGKK
jgi:ArsR family transcriptional regulator, virulence genes transcriptional regulator